MVDFFAARVAIRPLAALGRATAAILDLLGQPRDEVAHVAGRAEPLERGGGGLLALESGTAVDQVAGLLCAASEGDRAL